MLNFRKELTRIRQEIGKKPNEKRQFGEHAEHILKQILQYYENPESITAADPKEINFRIDEKNHIIVKILDLDDEEGNYDYYISYNFQTRTDAKKVLLLLCSLFQIEDYQIMYGKKVERDEEFSVLIH